MNTVLAILNAVVNSLWQALAVTALVWLALRFAHRGRLSNNAATRHAIWWATLGVVLVLPVAPRLIQMMRPHPQPAVEATTKAPKVSAPAVAAEPFIVTVAPGRTARWPIAIFAVWAAILLWRMFQIGRSYVYLRGVKRRAAVSPVPLPAIARHADLLISGDIVSPMAVGFLRPAIVLPESLLAELSEAERDHILLHESAHLAKYDDWSNLAMRIMGGVLALHPVAIWILRRIEREREMACDDWVVARTGSARPYAASLARLVELRQARRGEMLASGIFGSGSNIGDRIEILLRRGRTFSPRASNTGLSASAVVLGGLLVAGSLAPRWIAFAQTAARPAFEVASIKPNNSGGSNLGIRIRPGGRLVAANASVRSLITEAYQVRDFEFSGGPAWLNSARYDIEARGQDSSVPSQILQMLQTLLGDRFQLRVHWETKELPVYALLIAKNGPKLEPSCGGSCFDPAAGLPPPTPGPGQPPSRPCGGFNQFSNQMLGARVPMSHFAATLAKYLGRTVVDNTGLDGIYDISLRWTPDETQAFLLTGPVAEDSSGPSIFSAVQEQLGLKLESTKGPVKVLIIDHAEKPDAD